MIKVYPVSLGCPKNKADFEKLLYVLSQKKYQIVLLPEEADILWVNTCAFIRPAVEEAIEHILELGEQKRDGQKLIVSGCLTSRYGKETLKELLPEVDEFLGIEPFKNFVKKEPLERILTESPFYAYLKISDGCNYRCSYCTIPKIRGSLRSRAEEELLKEAENLLRKGVKEIILVGQDITSYGRDKGEKEGLLKLIYKLSNLSYEFRIRLLYLHPAGINKKFVKEILSNPKVVPYFDIPLQHAHPDILKKMRRPVNSEKIKEIIACIREINPYSAIRTTVIVGFPGEGEKEFFHLYEFVKEIEFDHLGVFIFYPEEGTSAEKMVPRVKYKEKIKRKKEILKLQKEISKKRLKMRIGSLEEVLILGEDIRGRLFGVAKIQAPEIDGITYILGEKEKFIYPGDLVKVKIEKAGIYDLWGEVT
ncbi:MAG: MiaB/RimO family radical SAM methylthiotransferase [Thermodesulfobacterium sp.]|nr:MiaB/RimO family radical SAM methylthiotransferase [Thermodesulfobacterium sp.]